MSSAGGVLVAQLDGVVEADLVEDVLLVLCHRAHVND